MKTQQELISIVNAILSESDPMTLIAMGAPKDEYLPEAKMIAKSIMDDSAMNCSPRVIFDVFLKMFEEELTKEECSIMSKQINKALAE